MASHIKVLISILVLCFAIIVSYLRPNLIRESWANKNELIGKINSIAYQYSLPLYSFFVKEKAPETSKPKTDGGSKDRLLTKAELLAYDGGADSPGLHLAILGKIYDVEKGSQHYKAGGGYAFFAGKDASRAYITGDFSEEGLTDDVTDLKDDQLLGIQEWVEFYNNDYTYVGKLVGLYYDEAGNPTEALQKVEMALDRAKEAKKKEQEDSKIFPPCNTEWSHDLGGRVWCTKSSGGIERDWVGVPRKLFKPGATSESCVCVRNVGPPSTESGGLPSTESGGIPNNGDLDNPNLKEYSDCQPNSESCDLKKE